MGMAIYVSFGGGPGYGAAKEKEDPKARWEGLGKALAEAGWGRTYGARLNGIVFGMPGRGCGKSKKTHQERLASLLSAARRSSNLSCCFDFPVRAKEFVCRSVAFQSVTDSFG